MRWLAALAICAIASTSARADWEPRRDPFDAGVVRRYKAILARHPYDAGALRQLTAMYKQHRTVAKLEAEYRAQAEDWATLVVRARLAPSEAAWQRVVAVKPDDARGWIALGDAARRDSTTARDAYLRAAEVAATTRDKRTALTKLAATARDAPTIDAAYAGLIALAPKDARLWIERGNVQLAAKQFAAALDSFAAAEKLLRGDPERRLTAITSQGIALEGLGRGDDAITAYKRALDRTPRGYYLAQEVVLRIVDTERRRQQLPAAITWIEQRWPERARGYFEWSVLGDLHRETHDDPRAIAAYKRAVRIAPTEAETQRKLIALLDKVGSPDALAQHESAARFAPGDATIQIELAKRYHPVRRDKAFATLAALSRRLHTNISVRAAIAALYDEWEEPARAIVEYEAVARLEPGEPSHAIALGEAYWRANEPEKARAAWNRLDAIETADAAFRHGAVLAMHEAWEEATAAYTKAIARDPTHVDALYGRARAHEEQKQFADAVADARRAVALGAHATHREGLRDRTLFVRVLGKAAGDTGEDSLPSAVARWRFAFDRGDLAAGYLLVAHHSQIRSDEYHDVLLELSRRAPEDDSLALHVARSYMHRGKFDHATAELERIRKRWPKREKDVAQLLEDVATARARVKREVRERARTAPDLVGDERIGMRFGIGSDVHESSGALVAFGVYRTRRLSTGMSWAWRVDWSKRDDDMIAHGTTAVAAVITRRLFAARRWELAASVGPRFEVRYGNRIPSAAWGRAAAGGDVGLHLLPHGLPIDLGVRFHQLFTGDRNSSVLVELGFEVR